MSQSSNGTHPPKIHIPSTKQDISFISYIGDNLEMRIDDKGEKAACSRLFVDIRNVERFDRILPTLYRVAEVEGQVGDTGMSRSFHPGLRP